VTLSGDQSYDPEGEPLTYRWTLLTTPPSSSAVLHDDTATSSWFLPDATGNYEVQLIVNDGVLDSAPAVARVEVAEEVFPPVADAGPDVSALAGSVVALDGSGSCDPGGSPLTYSWTLFALPVGSSAVVVAPSAEVAQLTPDVAGTYGLQLVVNNGALDSAPDEMIVTATAQNPTLPGDLHNGVFDPAEVYIFGTLSPGASYMDAIAHWLDPNQAVVGFDDYANSEKAQIRPDGTLLYYNTFEDILRAFHCDACPGFVPGATYPSNVLSNDSILATPPCDPASNYLWSFALGVDGGRIHECGGVWYDETGQTLPITDPVLSYGYSEIVLTEFAVVNLTTTDATSLTGFPGGYVLTARVSDATGFWVAMDNGPTELWRVDHQGNASLVDTYDAPPAGYSVNSPPTYSDSARLDAQGNLFQFGDGISPLEDVIIRRQLYGPTDVVYTEASNPAVQLHISSLVTGP
jgi:hypothetical protein